jgi:hypothetical protein
MNRTVKDYRLIFPKGAGTDATDAASNQLPSAARQTDTVTMKKILKPE